MSETYEPGDFVQRCRNGKQNVKTVFGPVYRVLSSISNSYGTDNMDITDGRFTYRARPGWRSPFVKVDALVGALTSDFTAQVIKPNLTWTIWVSRRHLLHEGVAKEFMYIEDAKRGTFGLRLGHPGHFPQPLLDAIGAKIITCNAAIKKVIRKDEIVVFSDMFDNATELTRARTQITWKTASKVQLSGSIKVPGL